MNDPGNSGEQGQSRDIAGVFNQIAAGYDREALRFFPYAADRLIARLKPAPGIKILDIATGTGVVALAAAQAVGAAGRVVGIDIAEGMLAQAEKKIRQFGIANVDLHTMDAMQLDFRSAYFDSVVCSYGLFFLPDIPAALREWKRVLKPAGGLMFTSFGTAAFHPMIDLFMARFEHFCPGAHPVVAAKLNTPEQCRDLLVAAGYADVAVTSEPLGYHLKGAADWWEVVYNSGLRGLLDQLPVDTRFTFQQEHMEEVNRLMTAQGLWLNAETLFSFGRKPAA
jgi:ubiquinone/menaquinone biosynthesis C-methylase UbiE